MTTIILTMRRVVRGMCCDVTPVWRVPDQLPGGSDRFLREPTDDYRRVMHPVIGITTYGRLEHPMPSDHYAEHYSAPVQYVQAVRRAGGVPVLLAPDEQRWERWLDAVDAVVVSGGADVEPVHYKGGPHPDVTEFDAGRDATELALTRAIIEVEIPGLFVCRGMQILNVALGGTLHPHIPDLGAGDIHRDGAGLWTYHDISATEGSRVAKAMGTDSAKPCSGHHQALDRIADDLVVSATAPDGIPEAVEYRGSPWIVGVQWHPEVSALDDPTQQGIFDALVLSAGG